MEEAVTERHRFSSIGQYSEGEPRGLRVRGSLLCPILVNQYRALYPLFNECLPMAVRLQRGTINIPLH